MIIYLPEIYLKKTLEMVDTRSYMQLVDLKFKPRGGKSLRDIIYQEIGVRLYPTPG